MRLLLSALFCLLCLGISGEVLAQQLRAETLGFPGKGWTRTWADVDNDGRDDFCIMVGDWEKDLECYLTKPAGLVKKTFYNMWAGRGAEGSQLLWGDLNGDGQMDVCRAVADSFTCRLGPTFAPGLGFSHVAGGYIFGSDRCTENGCEPPQYREGYENLQDFYVTDMNGDGLSDACYLVLRADNSTRDIRCRLVQLDAAGNPSFSAESSAWTLSAITPAAEGYPKGFYDFNGDGLPDYCRVLAGGVLRCGLASLNGFLAAEVSSAVAIDGGYKEGAAFVDVNADGKVDYCRIVGVTGNYSLRCTFSNGVGWEVASGTPNRERYSPALDPGYAHSRWWVDINGDGLVDFCRAIGPNSGASAGGDNYSHLACRLSRGDGDASNPMVAFYYSDVRQDNINFGRADGGRAFCDALGTGIATFCRVTYHTVAAGQECHVNPDTGDVTSCWTNYDGVNGLLAGFSNTEVQARQSLLTAYSDGLGAETRITYLPMNNPNVYVRSGFGKYPRALITMPRSPVVFETRAWQAGTQNTLTGNARYFYKDLRTDTWGGSRGFRERWIFTEGSNTLDHVVYYQGLGSGVDASSIENDAREVGLVKYQERFAVADGFVPEAGTTDALTARQRRIQAITGAAMRLSAVTDPRPSASSPFIRLQSTSDLLGDTIPANPRFRYVRSASASAWDWDGANSVPMPTSDSVTEMDDVGNVTSLIQTTTAPNGLVWRKTTTNKYDQDSRTNWILGRLTSATVKSEAPSADAQIAAYGRSAGNSPNASAISSSAPAVAQPLSPAVLSAILNLLLED